MPDPGKYDLTFVAPHKRAEVMRRIRVLDRFLASPGTRAAAEAAARKLDLRPTQFYRLAKAWRERRRPEEIEGAAKPRTRLSPIGSPQRQIVLEAERSLAGDTLNAVVIKARALGAERGIEMPSPNTIRKIAAEARQGKLPPDSPAMGADIVVVHCVIDVPVDLGEATATMPLATLVVAIEGTPSVLGLALSKAGPAAGPTARALMDAVSGKGLPDAAGRRPRIAIDSYVGAGWAAIREALSEAGLVLQGLERSAPVSGRDAVSLLGPRPCGIALRPGLVGHPSGARPATMPAGGKPIDLRDAETTVRGRLSTIGAPPSSANLSAHARKRLLRKLAGVAADAANH